MFQDAEQEREVKFLYFNDYQCRHSAIHRLEYALRSIELEAYDTAWYNLNTFTQMLRDRLDTKIKFVAQYAQFTGPYSYDWVNILEYRDPEKIEDELLSRIDAAIDTKGDSMRDTIVNAAEGDTPEKRSISPELYWKMHELNFVRVFIAALHTLRSAEKGLS